MRRTASRNAAIVFSAGLSAVVGCSNHDGIPPIPGRLEFPIAASLVDASGAHGAPTHLLVLNSNYYLSYNAAMFQSYDLATLEATVQSACVDAGIEGELCAIVPDEANERVGKRGQVEVVSAQGLLASEVEVGSFGEGIAVDPTTRHLYLPIRAYEDITHVALNPDGTFDCAQSGPRNTCAPFHRQTDHAILKSRDLRLPNEPLDVHVGDLTDFGMAPGNGNYLAVAHRTGQMSFFVILGDPMQVQPVATDVVAFPSTTFQTLTFEPRMRRFWAPTTTNSLILRTSLSVDAMTTQDNATFAEFRVAPAVSLTEVDLARSSAGIRQVAFDPRAGTPYEDRFYAVAARPSTLIVGRVEAGTNQIAIEQLLPIGLDPSRVALAELGGRMLAFVSCYASRDIYVYDVDSGQLVSIARGMNGPFEIALDTRAGDERMYVVDFRVSVIRLFDLSPLVTCLTTTTTPMSEPRCSPKMLGMLGVPSTVEELR